MTTLDLFAGAGGWDIAAENLGEPVYGVENWDEAIVTRTINCLATLYQDAWNIDEANTIEFDTLLASPPCQTFSVAGSSSGTRALADVLAAIHLGAFRSASTLRQVAQDLGDERTGLVLLPLAYIHRYRPEFVALEQVQAVLPVWEAVAAQLNRMGYFTWHYILPVEQYGVPQTRKRAVLMARRTPFTLPEPDYATFKRPNAALPSAPSMESALQLKHIYRMRSNYSAYGPRGATAEERGRSYRNWDEPSHVITSKPHSLEFLDGTRRTITVEEAASLQGFPQHFIWPERVKAARLMIGNAVPPPFAKAILEALWKDTQ